jgi:hypothetical protein
LRHHIEGADPASRLAAAAPGNGQTRSNGG